MDFTVSKSELLRELQYVQGVVERKTTVPILSNLLFETTGNALVVTATDLDVTVQCACSANIKVSGAVTVSARKMFDIVRLLPEADIHFKTTSAEWLSVTCERSRFKVATLSKENFPDVPSVEGETISLPAGALRYMINRCIFAITQEESRYTLNGALMKVKPGSITFVTTDGHRLALITHNCEITAIDGEVEVLVPKKTLVELGKLTSDDVATVDFGHSKNHLFYRVADRLLVSRILSGRFPNYEMAIPSENTRKVNLSSADFADALKRVSVMADEQSHAVRFAVKESQLEISSASADFGEATETVSADYAQEPLEIGFNALYLLDFLTGLESDEVTLSLKDKETQGLLQPGESKDYDYSYVVMPMKI
jgi:DNA polymerase-3 subunit beta